MEEQIEEDLSLESLERTLFDEFKIERARANKERQKYNEFFDLGKLHKYISLNSKFKDNMLESTIVFDSIGTIVKMANVRFIKSYFLRDYQEDEVKQMVSNLNNDFDFYQMSVKSFDDYISTLPYLQVATKYAIQPINEFTMVHVPVLHEQNMTCVHVIVAKFKICVI